MFPIRYEIARDPSTKFIMFAVMSFNQNFEDAFLKKKYDKDSFLNSQKDLKIIFNPEDTLNVPPGKYFYEVKYVK